MKTGIKNLKSGILIKSFVFRLVFFAAGWILLLGGKKPDDIWFVSIFIIAASIISIYSVPPGQWHLRPIGVIRFFIYFIITALRGGWDVARRAFSRRVSTDPEFIKIEHSPDPLKTLLLAWVISLLPGTASCVIKKKTIVIHVLDKNLPVDKEIAELQSFIDGMFREDE